MNQNMTPIAIAIVIAGVIIGGALYYSRGGSGTDNTGATAGQGTTQSTADINSVPTVSGDDHILGNANAPVVIIEYSDFECPFCKDFHLTMRRIMADYGKSGDVAWVFRHFPIPQLHSKAPKEAQAAECAAEQGGNDAFWKFADRIFEVTPSNNGLDPATLPAIIKYIGLDEAKFNECLSSTRHQDVVAKQYQEAVAGGAQGTPFSVIFAEGQRTPLNGSYPYEAVKGLLDGVLKRGGGATTGGTPATTP